MTHALNVTPKETDIDSGVRDPDAIADGLEAVLADTYRLTFKTHAYHWNVEGPLFYSLHNLTEGQYTDMFSAADVIAERIRAIGRLAPTRFADIIEASQVEDLDGTPSAGEMCEDLAQDHEKIAKRLHDLIDAAGERNDPVTEDLATARSAFHEQAAWMLKAMSAG
jgi:starvation-inducible DNA-binding protein